MHRLEIVRTVAAQRAEFVEVVLATGTRVSAA
jgi:hypothetical protein